jgi:hypothetical protein
MLSDLKAQATEPFLKESLIRKRWLRIQVPESSLSSQLYKPIGRNDIGQPLEKSGMLSTGKIIPERRITAHHQHSRNEHCHHLRFGNSRNKQSKDNETKKRATPAGRRAINSVTELSARRQTAANGREVDQRNQDVRTVLDKMITSALRERLIIFHRSELFFGAIEIESSWHISASAPSQDAGTVLYPLLK